MQEYLIRVAEAVTRVDLGEIEGARNIFEEVRESGNMVWLVGNGGSAATAGHFANDLTKMAGVRAIAVHSMISTALAYGNDNGWERMYADLLVSFMKPGDALVAISCSGKSRNVLEAVKLFHHNRLIIMTGNKYDSPLAGVDADSKIFVVDSDIRVQEDAHLAICHAIAGSLR